MDGYYNFATIKAVEGEDYFIVSNNCEKAKKDKERFTKTEFENIWSNKMF